MKRLVLRVIDRDGNGAIRQIIEQEIPATVHEIEISLRRKHFRRLIAEGLLDEGSITLERRK